MRLSLTVIALATALAACGCATSVDPAASVGHYVEGKILAGQGQLDLALNELASAVRYDPKLSIAHDATGDIHYSRGDYKPAQAAYELACKTNPYSFPSHYKLGATYKKLAGAAKAAAKAATYLKQAVKVYLRSLELEPGDYDSTVHLAGCYLALGKREMAEHYCKQAIGAHPSRTNAYNLLAGIYDKGKRLHDAARTYNMSLEIDSNQPEILLSLASIHMRQKRYSLAMGTFKVAIRRAPRRAEPWIGVGNCHLRTRRYKEALEAYDKALELDPRSHAAYRHVGIVRATQFVTGGRKSAFLRDKALEAWHRCLEIEPDQPQVIKLIRDYTPPPATTPKPPAKPDRR